MEPRRLGQVCGFGCTSQTSHPDQRCHAFQAQGGESQQEAQRLQAQLNELQAQLNQKEQAAEHYKLQVRRPQPWPTASSPCCPPVPASLSPPPPHSVCVPA